MWNAVLLKKISRRFFGLFKLISSIKSTICRSWKNTIWSTDFNNNKNNARQILFFGDCVFTKVLYLLREHFYDVLKNLHFCRRNKEAVRKYTVLIGLYFVFDNAYGAYWILSLRGMACRFLEDKICKEYVQQVPEAEARNRWILSWMDEMGLV
jgi:hypothetical protein